MANFIKITLFNYTSPRWRAIHDEFGNVIGDQEYEHPHYHEYPPLYINADLIKEIYDVRNKYYAATVIMVDGTEHRTKESIDYFLDNRKPD